MCVVPCQPKVIGSSSPVLGNSGEPLVKTSGIDPYAEVVGATTSINSSCRPGVAPATGKDTVLGAVRVPSDWLALPTTRPPSSVYALTVTSAIGSLLLTVKESVTVCPLAAAGTWRGRSTLTTEVTAKVAPAAWAAGATVGAAAATSDAATASTRSFTSAA